MNAPRACMRRKGIRYAIDRRNMNQEPTKSQLCVWWMVVASCFWEIKIFLILLVFKSK